MENIEIVVENSHERLQVPQGISLAELVELYYARPTSPACPHPILGALVNNAVQNLQYRFFRPKTVFFFDIFHRQGWAMYQSSLVFMLYKAVLDTYPQAHLQVKHSLQGGFFCTIEDTGIDDRFVVASTVRERMISLQQQHLPFENRTMLRTDAIDLIRNGNIPETVKLLESLEQLYVEMNFLDGTVHKMNGKLVPNTGCLATWDFRPYTEEGFILEMPDPAHFAYRPLVPDTPKLFHVFQDHQHWAELLQVPTVTDLNRLVRDHRENHLINVSEALHEKKYSEIADMIHQRERVRLVLLAGPSSSGKTTSCRRLSVQLSVLGYDVQQLSLDDYFVSRDRTPKFPDGRYDFENIEALDIPLLNEHLLRLFRGEKVEIPTFNFLEGNPHFDGKTMQMGHNSLLVVEGIHALNPRLTEQIPDELKFRIYVSALTQIAIDDINSIRSSENRLLRRIVRDNNFRGWDAYNTLHRWAEVRHGEEVNIFPFQEKADVMFNSALLYELGVLRIFAEPQLKRIPETCEEYAEAQRLLNFLQLVDPIDAKCIPYNSIMREFLGGSTFSY